MKQMAKIIVAVVTLMLAGSTIAAGIDWAVVDQALGRKGAELAGGVHKYGFPRADLDITVDGVAIKPAFALGGWVAFQPLGGDTAMLMGDLVLTDREISPVMKRLIDNGIQITAIHNHLLRMSMPVFYMHVGGRGDATKLAQTLRAALSLSNTPLAVPAPAQPVPVELDTAAIEKVLGFTGKANAGVYQFGIPRAEAISAGGMPVPPSLGTAIGINFQATGDGRAAITGDFVLLGSEVNPVLKALREHGIEVTALHNHMLDDSPHLFFMHFWANDDAVKLARSLRSALDLTGAKRGP